MSIAIIALFSVCILVYIIMFTYWVLSFERTGSKKFNFLTYFPFELNAYRRNAKDSFLNFGLIIISFILFIAPSIIFALVHFNQGESKIISSVFLMICFILGAIVFVLLLFTKLSLFKEHLILVCFFIGITMLLIVLEAIFFTSLKLTYYDVSKPYMSYITLAINILQLIFEFVLLLNPKYKIFHKMVRIDAETFSRPKINYLACLEWGTFINLLICYIPLIILSF